jgi:hypothetical protein
MINQPKKFVHFHTLTLLILLTGFSSIAQSGYPTPSQVHPGDSVMQMLRIHREAGYDKFSMPVAPLPGNESFRMPIMVPDSSVTYHLKILGYSPESATHRFIPDSIIRHLNKIKPGFNGEAIPEEPFRDKP